MWDQNPLIAGEPENSAHIEHSFNFLVDAADGLDFSHLVNRAGDSDVLS